MGFEYPDPENFVGNDDNDREDAQEGQERQQPTEQEGTSPPSSPAGARIESYYYDQYRNPGNLGAGASFLRPGPPIVPVGFGAAAAAAAAPVFAPILLRPTKPEAEMTTETRQNIAKAAQITATGSVPSQPCDNCAKRQTDFPGMGHQCFFDLSVSTNCAWCTRRKARCSLNPNSKSKGN